MRTKDIEKLGISEKFLRTCRANQIIKPKRIPCGARLDNKAKMYYPYEHSQEDIENLWRAYLLRKMGFSYNEIKRINEGIKVQTRESLKENIRRKEEEIAELQAIVEFMKYIKGVGLDFVLTSPNENMNSKSFKEYISDYIDYIDEDKKLKNIIGILNKVADNKDIENMKETEIKKLEDEITFTCGNANMNKMEEAFNKMLNKENPLPGDKEVQDVITEIINQQKVLNSAIDFDEWSFCLNYYVALEEDCDIRQSLFNCLGKKNVELLKTGILVYMTNRFPERIKKIAEA